MTRSKTSTLFSVFHGGRAAEFFLALLVVAAIFAGLSWWGSDWFFPDLMHYLAFSIIMALQAFNSVPIIKHHVSPTRWWISGTITAALMSIVFSVIPILIIHYASLDLLRNDLFSSYIIPWWRLASEVIIVEPFTMPTNMGNFASVAMTFLGILCVNLAVSLSGMALGAVMRSHGVRGIFALVAIGIIVVSLTAWVGNSIWVHSIPAPWPGIFLFSIPLILLAWITARVAAAKQTFGSETRAT